jgi:hypothetical protein
VISESRVRPNSLRSTRRVIAASQIAAMARVKREGRGKSEEGRVEGVAIAE